MGSARLESDLRMGDALQEHRLLQQSPGAFSRRITGAGMRAKDENSSTMRPISPTWRMMVSVHWSKISRIGGDLARIFALQPLGRELDRRQRILDLMGDAAGDIGPGGVALGRDQIGDVVEGDDKAMPCWPCSLGDLHAQRPRRAGALDPTSPLGPASGSWMARGSAPPAPARLRNNAGLRFLPARRSAGARRRD